VTGGNFHQNLNMSKRSIANKYREGKLKSTPKGDSKDLKSYTWKPTCFLYLDLVLLRTDHGENKEDPS
jgi:hypothetical protein